ncbi:hypothetical protein A3A76_01040 [Candidatus Woesebacteria bacterium RIFCSPLOWO2_01_FULL_39_23]|uniref:Nucleotidyltransferase n=1 Tax=Candidatus Woesebacteria bacterium RIFCSPHIGHO2_01_FULL_40_22 TaxID=1802499 RepID=A0A1F7YHM8_9BACT|nr:MAG: hypothetical protein A2141_05685 [Candidatus Woesebacteria bacterium RBG_16_40_11]OGM26827.1 MAG: hypothetical protein A2628_04715 [Candidatus Woesebacteria bacterium RIFCSPHIGHO2_01_FULL_40_22]OGM63124.1 MAG: hypothetical protein A3A76_01040 [Candidatus Woesebacteria bacterium RIFCSPLOWO2_01_FULL_39_23]
MSDIHFEILDPDRLEVFKLLAKFKKYGVLGGGTAIALQIKHRKSFDFDIFLNQSVPEELKESVKSVYRDFQILREEANQIDYIVKKEIKLTFLKHAFPPLHSLIDTGYIELFNLKDLASNKAATIGRRGTWRDYVDLFFLIKDGTSNLKEIIDETEKRFGGEFNKRLFLEQLLYTRDITDYEIDFLGKKHEPEEIKNFFEDQVKSYNRF